MPLGRLGRRGLSPTGERRQYNFPRLPLFAAAQARAAQARAPRTVQCTGTPVQALGETSAGLAFTPCDAKAPATGTKKKCLQLAGRSLGRRRRPSASRVLPLQPSSPSRASFVPLAIRNSFVAAAKCAHHSLPDGTVIMRHEVRARQLPRDATCATLPRLRAADTCAR